MKSRPNRPKLDSRDRAWTKVDARIGEQLLRATRGSESANFDWLVASLIPDKERQADVFLLLLMVAYGAVRFGKIRRSVSSQDMIDLKEVVSGGDVRLDKSPSIKIVEFIFGSSTDLPGPPKSSNDLFSVVFCCNAALDQSVRRSKRDVQWEKRYRSLASAVVRKRVAVSHLYRSTG